MRDFPGYLATCAVAALMIANASAGIFYVDVHNTNPHPPYSDWPSAATNIQDAVDAANDGDLVLVTNGLYQAGGRVLYGALTNRVAVTKAITLQSVNGPDVTTIGGNNQISNPSVSVRCVCLTNGSVLSGFTLANGSTLPFSSARESDGAGVWCESTAALITNCVITGSAAFGNGGGAFSGTLVNCTLTGNSAAGGGAANSAYFTNCVLSGNIARGLGGAAQNCTISACILSNNVAPWGGGAAGGQLTNSTIIGNGTTNTSYPQGLGGGVYQATLNNCSLLSNTALQGGGVANSTLTNCTLAANRAISFGGGGGAYNSFLQGCTLSTNLAQRGGAVAGGTLINCTLTGNSAQIVATSDISDGGGAYGCPPGAWCNYPYCTLINCVLIGNQSTSHDGTGRGGGTSGCFLFNCLLSGNYASEGSGAYESALTGCTLMNHTGGWGGAGAECTLNSCLVVSNQGYFGGGLYSCGVTNSTLVANSAYRGGGAALSALNNCTVVFNSAVYGGGIAGGTANNCIIYSNLADDDGPNYVQTGLPLDTLTLNYCCTTPMPTTNGFGNITDDPGFFDVGTGNFHLQPNSPCINSGKNSYVAASSDCDGNPRISGGTVDIGAYEFQGPASTISYAWLQQYGLPIDGTADLADADHDGMNNWQEWICGTDPTNSLSVLKMFAPSNTALGLALSWQSAAGRTYDLQQSDPANPTAFSSINSNIAGQADVTTFLDAGATNIGSRLYRVRVQP
jgi:hypothetical protein